MASLSVSSPVVTIGAVAAAATTYAASSTDPLTMWVDLTQASNGKATATVTGSQVVTGANLALTVSNSNLSGGEETQSYSVQSTDTFSSVAAAIAAQINGDSALSGIGLSATASGAAISLAVAAPTYSTSTSVGATETLSLGFNNAGSTAVTVAGTPTAGDVLTVTTTDSFIPGGQTSTSYTVQAGDSLVSIAAGLASAINASSALSAVGITAASSASAAFVGQSFQATQPLPSGSAPAVVSGKDGNNTAVADGNQVESTGSASTDLSFDLNGNISTDGTNTFVFDAHDRLIEIDYPGTGNNTRISYDGLGHWVKIVETTGGTTTSTKQFVWSGSQLCEERDADGAVTRRFFSGGEQINGSNYFYVRDQLGSIRAMTDSSGNVVARYDYTPFGVQSKLEGTVDSDFGFAGYYVHQRSGMNITVSRAYSPKLGRFSNRDPKQESAGTNLYAYTRNDPINLTDPSGTDAGGAAIGAAIGAGIGGIAGSVAFGSGGTLVAPGFGTVAGGIQGWQAGAIAGGAVGAAWGGRTINTGGISWSTNMNGSDGPSNSGNGDSDSSNHQNGKSCPNKRPNSPRGPKRPRRPKVGHGSGNYRGGQGWSHEPPSNPQSGPPGTSQDLFDTHGWEWFRDWLNRYNSDFNP